MSPVPPPDRRRTRGQATVELALALPFVALVLLLVAQVLLVAHGQLVVEQAAREGARIAAVDPDPAAVERAALAGGLPPSSTTVAVADAGAQVRVVVRHRLRTDLPLVGPFLPDLDLEASAAFRREVDPPGGG